MNKELISGREGINLLIMFMFGSTLIIGTGGEAENDMWIAILLGVVLTIPVVFIQGFFRFTLERTYLIY